MAKAKRNKKASKRNKTALKSDKLGPTDERRRKGYFQSMGMAYRNKPMIDVLRDMEILSAKEWEALAYYRDQALLADKSPVKSCIDFSPKGGHGPGVAIMSAQFETGRIERGFGGLWPLCRAVVIEDKSLEQWCIEQGQCMSAREVEDMQDEKKRERARLAMRNSARTGLPVASPAAVAMAALELKYASGSVVVDKR